MRMCHFWAQNSQFAPNKIFLEKKQYYFHLPIGPFPSANLKKKINADPELQGCAIFRPKWPICPNENFF